VYYLQVCRQRASISITNRWLRLASFRSARGGPQATAGPEVDLRARGAPCANARAHEPRSESRISWRVPTGAIATISAGRMHDAYGLSGYWVASYLVAELRVDLLGRCRVRKRLHQITPVDHLSARARELRVRLSSHQESPCAGPKRCPRHLAAAEPAPSQLRLTVAVALHKAVRAWRHPHTRRWRRASPPAPELSALVPTQGHAETGGGS
jgi:hypothetical protein